MKRYLTKILWRINGELQTQIMSFEAPSLASAKRQAKELADELDGRVFDCFEIEPEYA